MERQQTTRVYFSSYLNNFSYPTTPNLMSHVRPTGSIKQNYCLDHPPISLDGGCSLCDALLRIRLQVSKQNLIALLITCITLLLTGGCGTEPPKSVQHPTVRPLRAMESAIRRGLFEEAWSYAEQVAAEHSNDSEVLTKLARLANDTQRADDAAKYLKLACVADNYTNPKRVQQAMIAMVGVGDLFDGLELLSNAVNEHPEQHESRRWLFDLLMGSEDRQAGLPHGRYLIRVRKFDVELLKALSNTEYRTMDAQPLLQMTERNPDDTRPLLGYARQKYDERDFDGAIKILQSIVDPYPEYAPAQGLLGRSLAGDGDWKAFEKWVDQLTVSIVGYPEYWMAMGDWARAKEKFREAARCYWEATKVDSDLVEAWTKLSLTLKRMLINSETVASEANVSFTDRSMFTDSLLERIDQRATLLSTFNQQKQKFERTGGVSRETAIELAKTLQKLGRLWEAEAWCSIALQLPEDDAVKAEETRAELISQLSRDTPWQTTVNSPELQIDLTSLEIPSISRFNPVRRAAMSGVPDETSTYELSNEATKRGLDFFGKTSDKLDQPGIMLYQTLGCGGGTLDFDLDGWSDLYLAAAEGKPPRKDSKPNALFRNQLGHFTECSLASNSDERGFTQGIAVGDINEDGFPDLLILNYGPNTLLVNNGDGTFSDRTQLLDINEPQWSTSGAIADLNGDGLNDIAIVNYCDGTEPVTVTCPMPESDVFRSCSPVKFAAAADYFYQAQADGRLKDCTKTWKAKPTVLGRGLGIVVGALDEEVGNDILIANDMTNNHLWSFRQKSESDKPQDLLIESGMLRGLGTDDRALSQGSMGIASADFDQDGDLDFYVTNFDKEYNTLHDNRSSGLWQDVTSTVNLASCTMPLVGFGTEAVDLNASGKLELIVANGHVDMFSRGNEKSLYEHPMQLFQRGESSTYVSVGERIKSEYFQNPHVARALWTIDANGDHASDFVVTHQTEPTALLINHCTQVGTRISLDLRGTASSRDAVGSLIRVKSDEQTWSAWLLAGDGYLCSNERTLRIGLGQAVLRCDVEVQWPSGLTQEFKNLETNHQHLLTEADQQPFTYHPSNP